MYLINFGAPLPNQNTDIRLCVTFDDADERKALRGIRLDQDGV